jgi:D-sedoheptulose 7-phosphate isomerase
MKEKIKNLVEEHFGLKTIALENMPQIERAANLLLECLRKNGKVLVCGNGGSAADSQHFAAELVGRFQKERKGLACVALTTDSSIMTSVSNDYGFERVFERQVEALSNPGDVVIGITTSGNSKNILRAIEKAKQLKGKTILLNGRDGGFLKGKADVEILVPAQNTARIQEMHILILHVLCDLVEGSLFDDRPE